MESSILYSEISCLCILILILLSVKLRESMFVQTERRVLYLVMISNILFFFVDAVWIFINHSVLEITVYINWLLNAIYFILSGIIGYLWYIYSETVQKSKFIAKRKNRFIVMGPVIILAVLTMISVKTGWIFYIDSNNVYHRGDAYLLQLICAYGYVVFTASKALIISIHTNNYQRKMELKTVFMFAVPTLVSGILQVLFPGFPIICVGNTFGILYVFVSQQAQLISVDPLTKLNNRNQLYQYLSTKFSHVNENRALYLLLMDMDFFKSINDQYGHIEGDRALIKVAGALRKIGNGKQYFICRYGGDEFILICELELSDHIQNVCNAIHSEMTKIEAPYQLSVSIGCAKYSPEFRTQQDFISKADHDLYQMKKRNKK